MGDRNDDKIWELLQKIHAEFFDAIPDYVYGLSQNSNSYAATLAWMVGIDISGSAQNAQPTAAVDGFVGGNLNLLTDGYGHPQ